MLTSLRLAAAVASVLVLGSLASAQAPRRLDPNDRQSQLRPVHFVQDAEKLPAPTSAAPAPAANPYATDPIPAFRMPMGGGNAQNAMQPPPLPPYAWPTYAPYNNYSRVAYPNTYPSCAFPHIGPFYPFPKAPLGWRKVVLQFDDCHWYLSSHAGPRDWWSVRYW